MQCFCLVFSVLKLKSDAIFSINCLFLINVPPRHSLNIFLLLQTNWWRACRSSPPSTRWSSRLGNSLDKTFKLFGTLASRYWDSWDISCLCRRPEWVSSSSRWSLRLRERKRKESGLFFQLQLLYHKEKNVQLSRSLFYWPYFHFQIQYYLMVFVLVLFRCTNFKCNKEGEKTPQTQCQCQLRDQISAPHLASSVSVHLSGLFADIGLKLHSVFFLTKLTSQARPTWIKRTPCEVSTEVHPKFTSLASSDRWTWDELQTEFVKFSPLLSST